MFIIIGAVCGVAVIFGNVRTYSLIDKPLESMIRPSI